MTKTLAIIIPAYKPDFLAEALRSLEAQTCQDFQVYIGDDHSPFDLEPIVQPFVLRNGWIFHRFGHNLGGTDLASHWNRCVEMSSEPWVWLFSDDDVMEPGCVDAFLRGQEAHPDTLVFRFPFAIIDKDGRVTHHDAETIDEISGFEFGFRRFGRTLLSSAVEFVFSREAWTRHRGFVRFPLAWCSDDASWIAFTGNQPIRTLDGGKVFWRLSESNISSQSGPFARAKLRAAIAFINWFNLRFPGAAQTPVFGEQIIWFRLQIEQLGIRTGFWQSLAFTLQLSPYSPAAWIRTFNEIFCRSYLNLRFFLHGKEAHGFRRWLSLKMPWF